MKKYILLLSVLTSGELYTKEPRASITIKPCANNRALINKFLKECDLPHYKSDLMCLGAYVVTPTKAPELVGVITFTTSGDTYIQSLGVDPRYKKQGIGTKLLLAVEEYTSCNSLELYSYSESVAFYQKIGFTCEKSYCFRGCKPKDPIAFKSKI